MTEYAFRQEVHKSAKVLKSFWKIIPRSALIDAQGIAIVRVYKIGFHGLSARAGGGCMVARLNDGKWSPPLLVSSGGLGIGIQLGIEKINLVFILRSKAAVESFTSDSITLGGSMGLAAGPVGRNVEAAGTSTGASIWTYCQTKGLYLGVAIESSIIHVSGDNSRFYGCAKREILQGRVGPFAWANELYDTLDLSRFISFESSPKTENELKQSGSSTPSESKLDLASTTSSQTTTNPYSTYPPQNQYSPQYQPSQYQHQIHQTQTAPSQYNYQPNFSQPQAGSYFPPQTNSGPTQSYQGYGSAQIAYQYQYQPEQFRGSDYQYQYHGQLPPPGSTSQGAGYQGAPPPYEQNK